MGADEGVFNWRAISVGLVFLAYVAGSTGFVYRADAKANTAIAEARQVRTDVRGMADKLEAQLCLLETRMRAGEQQGARTEAVILAVKDQIAMLREDLKGVK